MVYSKENQEPYDHMKDAQDFYRVTDEFKSAMGQDPAVEGNHEVKLVVKVALWRHVFVAAVWNSNFMRSRD